MMTRYSYFNPKGKLVATVKGTSSILDADDKLRRLTTLDPLRLTCAIGVRLAAFDLNKSKTVWTSKVFPGTKELYFDPELIEHVRRHYRYNPMIRLFIEVPCCGQHRPRQNYHHDNTKKPA